MLSMEYGIETLYDSVIFRWQRKTTLAFRVSQLLSELNSLYSTSRVLNFQRNHSMTGIFGETLNFTQENGPEVSLVVNGDEYYARYETSDGYAVVYDKDLGLYCYAMLKDGKFVSSKIPISGPPPAGLPSHLEESDKVRAEKAAAKLAARNPPD
jgi:hypothetical protein